MSIRRTLLPWCEHICTLYFAVGKTSLTLCSPSCFTHKYINLYMTVPFFFFSGWLSSLTSGSLFFFFFYYNISPPAPSPVSSITVTTPPEVHASKGDTVTLSCSFTSTSRPTSRMTVDWSYRPQSGGPPMMVSILLSKLTSRLCCSQCCKIMCVLYLQP